MKGSLGHIESILNLDLCGRQTCVSLSWAVQKGPPLGKALWERWIWVVSAANAHAAPLLTTVSRVTLGRWEASLLSVEKIPAWFPAITKHKCVDFSFLSFQPLQPSKNKSNQPSGHRNNTTTNKQLCLDLHKQHFWSQLCPRGLKHSFYVTCLLIITRLGCISPGNRL